jgi:histidine triad (HIT) family protein
VSQGCLFCSIIAGELTAHRIFEDETRLAFLDHRPLFAGHTLIIPKSHIETLPDLPEGEVAPLWILAQRLCTAFEQVLGADGSFVAVNNRVSQAVPHLHVHIVPRRSKDGLRGFFWPRQKYASDEEAAAIARDLRAALAEGLVKGGA